MSIDSTDDIPTLEELYREGFMTYLYNARSMMIDDVEPGAEVEILIHTYRRTEADRNIWDLVYENRDGEEVILETVDVTHWDSATDLMNELARKAGVDLDFDEEDEENMEPSEALKDRADLKYID